MYGWLRAIGSGLFILLALGACDKMRHLDPQYETLDERIYSYHEAFQWREYKKAAEYVMSYKRGEFLTVVNDFRDKLTVDSFRIESVELNDQGDEAQVAHAPVVAPLLRDPYLILGGVLRHEDIPKEDSIRDVCTSSDYNTGLASWRDDGFRALVSWTVRSPAGKCATRSCATAADEMQIRRHLTKMPERAIFCLCGPMLS